MRIIRLLTITFALISFAANATTKSPQLRSRTAKKGIYTERYKVLASDTTVRHGAYTLLHKGKLLEKGQYKKDNRAGVWEFYGLDEVVELRYDYDQELPVYILPHNEGTYNPRTFPSVFLGSPIMLYHFVALQTPYPTKEAGNQTDCPVTVALEISASGKLTGYHIEEGSRESFNEAVLRAVEKIPPDWRWVPARKDGRNVASTFRMTIIFEATD